MPLSPCVEEPLNSKVIKSLVPEQRSRYMFFEFRDSYYIYIYIYVWIFDGLVSLFNGISTFVGYLTPKPFPEKNSGGTI